MQMNLIIASDYYDRSYSPRIPPPPLTPLPVIGPSGNPPKKLLSRCLEMNWIRFIMTILSLLNNPQNFFFYQLCYGLLPLYLEHLIS